MEERFALLIDADNVSAKYIKPILDELSKYGNVTYKRIYGDWTRPNSAGWKEELLQNSITPIQQFSYTYGKNATDSAMIIDAMDMLYASELEGFCLVSSDSDFTRLASRLRESGKRVIGMGEAKTPLPFRKACEIFTELELLLEDNMMSSGLKDAPIRWLVDDCVKFVEREIRRGNTYDAIIMDPPSYGRGPKGEIWKIEDMIHPLIKLCTKILSKDALFFLVNSYTTGLAPAVLTYMISTELKPWNGHVESQEIGLPVTDSGLVLPCGASGRWESDIGQSEQNISVHFNRYAVFFIFVMLDVISPELVSGILHNLF